MKSYILLTAVVMAMTCARVSAADAKENWDKACTKCHGASGKGDSKMGKKLGLKDLTDAKVQAGFTDEKAFKVIKEGLKDGNKTLMKPAENMSDAEITALVTHLRGLKK